MTLSRIFKTIFLVEFIKGLLMAIKEMFKKSKTVKIKNTAVPTRNFNLLPTWKLAPNSNGIPRVLS